MLVEVVLGLVSLLLYHRTGIRSFILIALSVVMCAFTKFALIPLVILLYILALEIALSSAYKSLNNSRA